MGDNNYTYGEIDTDGHQPQTDALRDVLRKLVWSDYYGIKDDMMANGCIHGFKPAASCPNAGCEKGELEREINAALEQSNG
jgi:hypothetical protein